MSELTTINSNNYELMSQMMGVAADSKQESKASLARLRIVKKPIMGETNVDGKNMKVEVVSSGSYGMSDTDNNMVYSDSVLFRPYLQRFSYQRYNNEKNKYTKTVMAADLNKDLNDTSGGFNCGKPSGYIKDFDGLSNDMKEIIRSVRRVRVMFGEVSVPNGITAEGDAQPLENIPCIWELDSKEGFKNMGDAFANLAKHRRLPIHHMFNLTTERKELPTGATYFVPVCSVDVNDVHEITPENEQVFNSFLSYIENYNQWVMSEFNKEADVVIPESKTSDQFIDAFLETSDEDAA